MDGKGRWAGTNGRSWILVPGVLLLSALLFGCSKVAPTKLLATQSDEAQRPQWSLEIRFPQERKGGQRLSIVMSGDTQSYMDISQIIIKAPAIKEPPVTPFSPELLCDVELDYTKADTNEKLCFLYSTQYNVLVYKQGVQQDGKTVFQYSMFEPEPAMGASVQLQRQLALLSAAEREKAQSMALNTEELKVQIDPEKLKAEGEEKDFEFYTGELQPSEGTAVRVYTSADSPDIPDGKVVFIAMTSDASGKSVPLSITGFEENDDYTKFFVSLPQQGDTQEEGVEEEPSNMVLVDQSELDADKWIVFLQESGEVMDVILPEYILDTAA